MSQPYFVERWSSMHIFSINFCGFVDVLSCSCWFSPLSLSLGEYTRFYKLCLNPKSDGLFYVKRHGDLFLSLCKFFLHWDDCCCSKCCRLPLNLWFLFCGLIPNTHSYSHKLNLLLIKLYNPQYPQHTTPTVLPLIWVKTSPAMLHRATWEH